MNFEFGNTHPIAIQAQTILRSYGILNTTGLKPKIIFEDGRIYIEGIIGSDVTYHETYIAIKLETGDKSPVPDSFGLPRKNTDAMTGVYLWNSNRVEMPSFIRPGKWMKYVEHLYQDVRKQREETKKLNQKPIDDSSLFKDIE